MIDWLAETFTVPELESMIGVLRWCGVGFWLLFFAGCARLGWRLGRWLNQKQRLPHDVAGSR